MARKSATGNNIYLRKDGRWEGRLRIGTVNGKTIFSYIYAASYEEAVDKLSRLTSKQPETDFHQTKNSFQNIANEWMALQRVRLKPSSISSYTNILNSYLIPRFGDRDISDIRRSEFIAFVYGLLESRESVKKGLSTSTVNTILTVSKGILRYAAREKELIVADICGIPLKKTRGEPSFLSETEQSTLLCWLYKHLSPCNLGILLSLCTGIRLGELCALKWKDIAKEDQSVMIYQTMQRIQCKDKKRTKVVVQSPKSASAIRTIPVTEELAALLTNNRKEDEAYLLTGKTECYLEPRTLQRRFKKVLKESGIDDINFHALRHTFATRGIEAGFDPKTLSSLLGHATVSITLNRYVHPTMEQKQRNMNLLSGLLAVRRYRRVCKFKDTLTYVV